MNRRKKIYKNILICLLFINVAGILYLGYNELNNSIPSNIKIIAGAQGQFDFSVPVEADFETEDVGVIQVNNKPLDKGQIHLNLTEPFSIESSETGSYKLNLKLFGLIKFKEVNLDIIEATEVIPCGIPIGIYVETDGVMVLGTSPISSVDGLNYEPALNILKTGDYITKANGKKIKDKKDLISQVQNSNGEDIRFSLIREEEEMDVKVRPIKTVDGEYKIGTWIRDNTQGIGTLTYVEPDGSFGALGHGITDIDTSLLMNIKDGSIFTAKVMMVVKGEKGTPGEIVGLINQTEAEKIGKIEYNTNQGIFGKIKDGYKILDEQKPMPIALKQEIKLGKAKVRCEVDGKIQDYNIEIQKIDMNSPNMNKGMVIKITDSRLLNITNGIVQGMSGSPIIQNGKIIGAVTHVFIQDPSKGYGTFIENMLRSK